MVTQRSYIFGKSHKKLTYSGDQSDRLIGITNHCNYEGT